MPNHDINLHYEVIYFSFFNKEQVLFHINLVELHIK
jgi:hypothetical protein